MGQGSVIACWEQVIRNMSKKERIQITCPYNLAYGVDGAGEYVPPKTDLNFDIEILEITNMSSQHSEL